MLYCRAVLKNKHSPTPSQPPWRGQQSSGVGWVGVGNRAAVKHEKLLRVINPCLITTTQLHVPSKCPASSEHNYTGWPAGFFSDLLYKSCCWSAHVLCTRLHGQPEWLMLLDQFCKRLWVAVMQLEVSLLSLWTEWLKLEKEFNTSVRFWMVVPVATGV